MQQLQENNLNEGTIISLKVELEEANRVKEILLEKLNEKE